MMRWFSLLMLGSLAFAGCNKDSVQVDDDDDTTETDTDTDTDTEVPPISTYTSGQYRLSTFELLDIDGGIDLDGDGDVDNNLPNALIPVDSFVDGYDFTREGINTRISESLADASLIILMEAFHEDPELALDVLAGKLSAEGVLEVDPASYGEDGNPTTRLLGEFSTETTFGTLPGDAFVPVTFIEGEPPVAVPLRNAQVLGDIDKDTSNGLLVGVIPAESLVNEVISPMIPEEGFGNYTKDQLIGLMLALAEQDAISDIEFEDGTRGVSAAFSYVAEADSF